MTDPWLKHNRFLGMWLSKENCMAGSLRGRAIVHGKRQVKASLTEGSNENIKVRSAAITPGLELGLPRSGGTPPLS